MKLIPDIRNWHRFRSVQFGLLAGACAASLAAYGVARSIDPVLVSGIHQWFLTALTVGSMVFSFASVIARGIDQPKLDK